MEKYISKDALHGRLDELRDGLEEKYDMLMPESLVRATIDGLPTVEIPRWIPLDEMRPDENKEVMVYETTHHEIDVDYHLNEGIFVRYGSNVTHWMPKPTPPEVQQHE